MDPHLIRVYRSLAGSDKVLLLDALLQKVNESVCFAGDPMKDLWGSPDPTL